MDGYAEVLAQLKQPAIYRKRDSLESRMNPQSEGLAAAYSRVLLAYLQMELKKPARIVRDVYVGPGIIVPHSLVLGINDDSLVARIDYAQNGRQRFLDKSIYFWNGRIYVIVYKSQSAEENWRNPRSMLKIFEDNQRVFEPSAQETYSAYIEYQRKEKREQERRDDEREGKTMLAKIGTLSFPRKRHTRQKKPFRK